VVLRFVVVNFMDRDGGVYDGGLDSLLLDDGLDCLVDMVVDVLASQRWCCSLGMLSLANFLGVLELSAFSLETLLYVVIVAVVDLTVLDASEVVRMLLWEDLLVLYRLDGSVVVVLVDLTVDSGLDVLMVGLGYVLVLDSGVDGLMNSGGVFSVLGKETGNCCLGFIHFDSCGVV